MSKTKKSSSRAHSSSESEANEYFNKNTARCSKVHKKSHKKRHEKYSSSDSQSSDSDGEKRNVKSRKEKGETRRKAEPKSKWDSPREQSTGYSSHNKHKRKENTADIYKHRNEDSRQHNDKAHVRQHTHSNRKTTAREHDRSYEDRHSSPERDMHRHQDRDRPHNDKHRSESNDNKHRKRNTSPESNRTHHCDQKRQKNRSNSGGCSPSRKGNPSNQEEYVWGKKEQQDKEKPTAEKDKPNFGLSGKLTEDVNTFNGVVIKYSEPPEARKPRRRWRLYPFKGENVMATLYIHRQSCYLIGRDRKVVDLPVDHPSCSKQHAALQYRLVTFQRDNGTIGKRIRPYLIDLESSNGTFVNNNKIEPKKYVELLERDVIKFGFSSREYVLLHENSKDDMQDDDVGSADEDVKNIVIKKEPN